MLIRFLAKNFLSIDHQVELSMVKGKVRLHPDHVIQSTKSGFKGLRTGIIYGANASGKSNLIKAMAFATRFITTGVLPKQTIPVQHFKLNAQNINLPSRFEFTFEKNGVAYIYGFELDQERIHSEWLYTIKKNGSPKQIFERATTSDLQTEVVLSGFKNISSKNLRLLDYAGERTRYNQLFLNKTIEDERKELEEVFEWFDEDITIMFPTSKYVLLAIRIEQDEKFLDRFLQLLKAADTGIDDINLREIEIERLAIPEEFLQEMKVELEPGSSAFIHDSNNSNRYLIKKSQENELQFFMLMTTHRVEDSDKVEHFELSEESDGTRRMMDLIPGLLEVIHSERLFVIDEIDRSVHPKLSKMIIKMFLQYGKPTSQLIVTTHESGLLDLSLLRRDELWFVEKDEKGASSVYSLEEFVPRYDKDIRKDYLSGRFGGIPIIQNEAISSWAN
jgi:uncharacterized protein